MVPDAFGELRILNFPTRIGSASGRGAQFGGMIIIPGAAASGMGVRFGSDIPRVIGDLFGVKSGIILIEGPFQHISEDIAQPPGVGFFLTDFLVFEITVLSPPAVFSNGFWVVPPKIGRLRA